jgi:hypothetical protein
MGIRSVSDALSAEQETLPSLFAYPRSTFPAGVPPFRNSRPSVRSRSAISSGTIPGPTLYRKFRYRRRLSCSRGPSPAIDAVRAAAGAWPDPTGSPSCGRPRSAAIGSAPEASATTLPDQLGVRHPVRDCRLVSARRALGWGAVPDRETLRTRHLHRVGGYLKDEVDPLR